MTKADFSRYFTPGHILTMATVLVTVAASFFASDFRSKSNAEDIAALRAAIEQEEDARVEAARFSDARLRELEMNQSRDDQRFIHITSQLDQIDDRLAQIQGALTP